MSLTVQIKHILDSTDATIKQQELEVIGDLFEYGNIELADVIEGANLLAVTEHREGTP